MKTGGRLNKLKARLTGRYHAYTCASCGAENWTDDLAGSHEEAERNGFGDLPDEFRVEVCGDCFHAIMSNAIEQGLHPGVYFDRDQPVIPGGSA